MPISIPLYIEGNFVADLRADYIYKKVNLFLKIANLFDKDYLYGDGYTATPRTWLIGAGYKF